MSSFRFCSLVDVLFAIVALTGALTCATSVQSTEQTPPSKQSGPVAENMARVPAPHAAPPDLGLHARSDDTRSLALTFIALVHRTIHRRWGFGVLEEWKKKPVSDPLNDETLLTTLEIVLNVDGTVDKATIIRASGLALYDTAAVDAVLSAAPYPTPPLDIRASTGKVYLHWTFYRDGRGCHPPGADDFLLNNTSLAADRRDGGVDGTELPTDLGLRPPG